MSDSLRDQLLKAGFSHPEADPPRTKQQKSRPGKRPPSHNKAVGVGQASVQKHTQAAKAKQASNDKAIAQRKAVKAQIKTLIESTAIKEYKGEVVYRFTLQNRIRELHIKEDVHKKLIADELLITRLNGSTYIVPAQTAQTIKSLNPDWAVVVPVEAASDKSEDYEAYPIPDDLQW